ncbi:hypothetical protein [Azohydromonas sediminis]|uniref:hypothetical protein n=1 Tax=Azohydromonas sediminis TaxID=2259674 RepID=UPI0013C369AA|nr:hypothetical protein [Azohydromonas sediminis]
MLDDDGLNDSGTADRPAGGFMRWRHGLRDAFTAGHGAEVPRGTPRACHSSGDCIAVRATEHTTPAVVARPFIDALESAGGRAPTPAADIALLAFKARRVGLRRDVAQASATRPATCAVEACPHFDATGTWHHGDA